MIESGQKKVGLVGMFDDPNTLIAAAKKVRDSGHRAWDCHTPYPVHGLEQAMGLKDSPIPTITIIAAFTGFVSAVVLTGGLNAVHYPLRVGGKPLFSWQAFVPIYFELFILFAALATLVSVVVYCKLLRWHSPLHDSGLMKEVTGDRLAIVLESADEEYIEQTCRPLLEAAGCTDIRHLFENTDDEPTI